MKMRFFTSLVLVAFIVLAGFGLFMPTMNHDGHDMGCPFAPGGTAICAAPLAHLKHWQSAFVTILAKVLVLVAAALVLWKSPLAIPNISSQYQRYRLRAAIPLRPPLLQELFSTGILNPKAP